jgi:DNA-binding response OmpR family regulator
VPANGPASIPSRASDATVMPDPLKTILVIEDDRDISSTIQSVLSGAGYTVLAASNGQDGRRIIQNERPDLVITDMMMPRMGGFPVLEFLAELPDRPPVIMMTANEGSRHKAYAEMLGVVDYLRKPFAMEVLLESVARALNPPARQTNPSH